MNDEFMIELRNELLKTMQSLGEMLRQREQAVNLSTHTPDPSGRFYSICYDDDDDEESTIHLNKIISQIPPSIAITHVLPTMEPEDSLIMRDENLSTILEKEPDEFIKSGVEDLVPIPSESEDTSDSDKECNLLFCDNSVTFSNPLFDANDDFTSSDDESLPEEDDIESKDSYVSNLDEQAFLVIPLSDANEDECFDPGGNIDKIDAFLDIDPSILYPSRLKEENFQALENPTRRADHFVYRIEIVDFLYDKFPIENNSLSGNPTPSSDLVVEYLSSFPIPFGDSDSLLEETGTLFSQINDYFPEYETFCFNIEEKSSGKKSSGSTTTHSDFSLPEYDLFIFDLSIDLFPPANRSVSHHEEFTDELAHIISPPKYDHFYFDLEIVPGEFTRVLEENIFDLLTKGLTINELKKSSGSTTTHSDYSCLDYEAFYFDDDHIKEKSSGSTTTHSDFSLPEYDLFIFDLSIDPFPPADRSVSHHEEFTDELAHIISPPKYDHFYFDLEIVPGEFTRVLEENIFDLLTKGLTINELNDSSLLLSDCDSSLSKEFFEIDLLVSFPSGNEDMIFDPRIIIIK
ncbi:hypothetical protein Tco_0175070 [Tanacetum coccineum]